MFTEYDIKFVNLKFGKHKYCYQIKPDFFEKFKDSLISNAEVGINLTLDMQSESLFLLDFDINGSIKLKCDRCLKDFDYSVHSNQNMILMVSSEMEESEDDSIICVSANEFKINIAEYIYQFIIMSVPIKNTCDLINQECNRQMINVLDELNTANQQTNNNIDPRWGNLRKLKK